MVTLKTSLWINAGLSGVFPKGRQLGASQ